MRLQEIIRSQFAVIETDYGVSIIDASCDQDEYKLKKVGHASYCALDGCEEVKEAIISETDCIEDCFFEPVDIYEGNVSGATSKEYCRVFVPSWWE